MRFLSRLLIWCLALVTPITSSPAGLPPVDAHRTPLTAEPNWRLLEPLQGSITRQEFEQAFDQIYSDEIGGWRSLFQLSDTQALVRMDGNRPQLRYRIDFGTKELTAQQRGWRRPQDLPPAPRNQPLKNLRIAIDPGHIGGDFAQMEGRWMKLGNNPAVQEGFLALAVAQRLKPLLEAKGAQVVIIRPTLDPVTPLRPSDLLEWTQRYYRTIGIAQSPANIASEADKFFFRVAEIRARAQLLEQAKYPADLAIDLHFNAAEWGNPQAPELVRGSHLHILVNGCYSLTEIQMDDQRMELLRRLLSRTHEVEIPLAEEIAKSSQNLMRLPAFSYAGSNARPSGDSPFVWARNLLANRIFPCPVVYMEPYLQNGRNDYARILAGAYEGRRKFNGLNRINIYDEYAQTVAQGVTNYYARERELFDPEKEAPEVEEIPRT